MKEVNNIIKLDYSPLNQSTTWYQYFLSLVTYSDKSYSILPLVFMSFVAIMLTPAFFLMIVYGFSSENSILVIISIGLLFCVMAFVIFLAHRGKYSHEKTTKIKDFTEKNNIQLKELIRNPNYNGILFNQGLSRTITQAYTLAGSESFEFGNMAYTRGRTVFTSGYIIIPLPRRVPHIFVDAKENNLFGAQNKFSSIYEKNQILRLEGNFDKHFTVYAPMEYKTDALYVLTPDVMQMLIDVSTWYDIEIIDNELYLYSIREFDLSSEADVSQVMYIASVFMKELHKQTRNYADIKVENRNLDIVSEEGRRLARIKTTALMAAISSIFVFAAMYFTNFFMNYNADLGEFISSFYWLIVILVLAGIKLQKEYLKRKSKK